MKKKFDYVGFTTEGLTPVERDGKYGFINKHGEIVVPIIYDWVDYFKDGLAGVLKGDKWGFVNKQGKVVIPIKLFFPLF